MPLAILFVFLLCLPITLFATDLNTLDKLLPKGTQVSYVVFDPVNNRLLRQSQQSTLRTPASLQKLLTATAAKLYLGEQFRYHTTIEGKRSNIQEGVYNGSLTLRFVGDPTLLRSDIRSMLQQLNKQGIKQISGDLLIDQSQFDGYQWSNGQAWNDLGVCYTSPSSAIIINKNCVLGNLKSKKADTKRATLFIPPYEPIKVTSDVAIVSASQRKAQFCDLELNRESHNQYHLWGCMVKRKQALPLSLAVNDPFDYASKLIISELKKVGIKLSGQVKQGTLLNKESVLVTHQSPPLDALIKIMMKESDNLIADSLFKTIGATYFNRAGNFRNGAEAVKQILKNDGIDLQNSYLTDGSGLSRHNLMSAEVFMSVLSYIYKHEKSLSLLASFSIAGVDGTLKYNRATRGKLLRKKVIAKTGSMKGVSNLLGVVHTPKGDRLFVLLLNGYNETEQEKENVAKGNALSAKFLYQKAFLETIYKMN